MTEYFKKLLSSLSSIFFTHDNEERPGALSDLSACAPGIYTIKWNTVPGEYGEYMYDLGLNPGSSIYLISECRGGVIVRAGEKRIALGRDTAQRIKV